MAARRVPRGSPLTLRSSVEQDVRDQQIVCEMLRSNLSRRIFAVASPVALRPVVRWLRNLFLSNLHHASQLAFHRRMLGRARDPHGGRSRAPHADAPGVLGELRPVVERAIAGIEELLDWRSERERVELDPKTGKRTGRKESQVFRVPASYRAALEKHLKRVLFPLRAELGRRRGIAPTLVWPGPYTQTVAVRTRRQIAEAHLQYLQMRAAKSADPSMRAEAAREINRLARELRVLSAAFRPARSRELERTLRRGLLRAGASKATAEALAHEAIHQLHLRVSKVRTTVQSTL